MQQSFKDMATRITNAERSFDESLQEIAGIDKKDAANVRAFYLKHKLAKIDVVGGTINVKHGAFLDQDVILRAVDQAR